MAFADLGDLGTANSKTSGTTVALTTSQTVNAGDLIVVIAAWDNTDTTDLDGLRHYVTDSAGNFYRYLGQWVNGNGAAAAGAEAMIFASVAEHQLTSGGTITCTSVNARIAKAIGARRFSLGTPDICLVGKAEISNDATDPSALSLSSLPSQEYLLLHCLASEGPNTDAYTWDSDYTQINGDGTTGSTADTNMQVRGGFRIATLTSDTVDVTSTTADRDYAQVFVAIREYTASPAPDAGLLDDFNRANETPLAAPWAKVDASGLKLISNAVAVQAGGTTPRGSDRAATVSSDHQGYLTLTTMPTANAADQIGYAAHISGEGNSTAWAGYTVTNEPRTGIPSSVRVAYTTAGNLGSDITQPKIFYQYPGLAAGDLIGMKTLGDTLEFWWKTGGAWRMFGAVDDTTARNTKAGMVIRDAGTSARIDDFHHASIIQPGFISSVTALYTPALNGQILPDFIASLTAVYTPALQGYVSVPFIASNTQVFTPAISVIDVPFISSSTSLYALTLQGYVAVPFIGSTTVVYTPTVSAPEVDVPFIASVTTVYGLVLPIAVPAGVLVLAADAPTVYPIQLFFANQTGVVLVQSDGVVIGTVQTPTSGVLTLNADAPTITPIPIDTSGAVVLAGDPPANPGIIQPPSGIIRLQADPPLPIGATKPPSGVIKLSADPPTVIPYYPSSGSITLKASPPANIIPLQGAGGRIVLAGTSPPYTTPTVIPSSGVVRLKADSPTVAHVNIILQQSGIIRLRSDVPVVTPLTEPPPEPPPLEGGTGVRISGVVGGATTNATRSRGAPAKRCRTTKSPTRSSARRAVTSTGSSPRTAESTAACGSPGSSRSKVTGSTPMDTTPTVTTRTRTTGPR